MSKASEAKIKINTASWMIPAINSIAKMGEDLLELGVPTDVAQATCDNAVKGLAFRAVKVVVPARRYEDGLPAAFNPVRAVNNT